MSEEESLIECPYCKEELEEENFDNFGREGRTIHRFYHDVCGYEFFVHNYGMENQWSSK